MSQPSDNFLELVSLLESENEELTETNKVQEQRIEDLEMTVAAEQKENQELKEYVKTIEEENRLLYGVLDHYANDKELLEDENEALRAYAQQLERQLEVAADIKDADILN